MHHAAKSVVGFCSGISQWFGICIQRLPEAPGTPRESCLFNRRRRAEARSGL